MLDGELTLREPPFYDFNLRLYQMSKFEEVPAEGRYRV
jgi:hypothetical protein